MTFKERAKALVGLMTLPEKLSQMRYDAPAIPRLGIPGYNWWNECLHGVARSGRATVFPQAIAMAASFDDKMMEKVGDVIATEGRAKYNEYRKYGDTGIYQGINFFAPNINIFRDPRWGRGHETYGEDPFLTAKMGTAFVNGLQGKGKSKYRKADATLKHYAVHSGPEDLRHTFDVNPSERDLNETYLWAFRYCIKHSDPSCVMGAYNRVYGEPCCGSPFLLEEKLRKEFGFDGYVVSDCGAICDFNENHKVTSNTAESAALAVNSGCDLNCGSAYQWLKTAVALGLLSEETVTKAVERLFEARIRLGQFDSDCEYDSIPYDVIECEEHVALSRKVAQDSMVLLKNDGILPLDPKLNIAVVGPNADDRSILLANYAGTPSEYVTILEGIREACEGKVVGTVGCHSYKIQGKGYDANTMTDAIISAREADVVVMVMGLNPSMEGEQGDAFNNSADGDKLDIELPESQKIFYEEIMKLGKPVVFVNVSGSAVALGEQDKNCNAVIQCFYPGAQGGRALADVLFGKVSPSGRLPVTFYASSEDLPPFEDYSMENRTYRYFKGTPTYAFGHGLTYSKVTEEWQDAETVKLTNCGKFDTAYSVLRFIENEEEKRLVGFKKVFLKAGESVTVKVEDGTKF
ncbi:MAG: glycoside hydrolase family 3 C-terminal domain-containing protein [Clostridia bacterium]|nr:glycoside hydrolase family 3 C-terminal domain-containing protein [Clostridia bacterium]